MRREGESRAAWDNPHGKLIGIGLLGICDSRDHFRHQ